MKRLLDVVVAAMPGLLGVVGFGLMVTAVASWSLPGAALLAGAMLLVAGVLAARPKKER